MGRIMERKKRLKFIAVVLLVVMVGVGAMDLLFVTLYKEPLSSGSCQLCYKLNPSVAECENYKPVTYSLDNPLISYGE